MYFMKSLIEVVKEKIENKLLEIFETKVKLASGGYLVINPTEALVSIDVNSGKSIKQKNIESTALKTNIEAANEIARQLRLRDLGGLVVIDFIDMMNFHNRRTVERRLRNKLKDDRARIQFGRINNFGLLEMTRQRIRLSLIDSMSDECPTCHGAGKIISIETLITRIDHWVRRYKSKFRNLRLRLDLHPENADFLIKNKKKVLRGLMWKNFVHISIESNVSIKRDQYRFFNVKDGKDVTNKVDIV